MKKAILGLLTASMIITAVPAHDADAASKKSSTKKYKMYNSYSAASVARNLASQRVYQYGANNNYAVDCSAFAQQFMKRYKGKSIPRTTYSQMNAGRRVSNPQPGDLVYFNGGSHVGVYIGNGRMVDALNPSAGVGERSISWFNGYVSGYYRF